MAAESSTDYIQHHLKNLTSQIGEGGFWTLHLDTLITALLMGGLVVFAFWLATRKATILARHPQGHRRGAGQVAGVCRNLPGIR